jgi:hypothetical protein
VFDFNCLRCGASYKTPIENPSCCKECHTYDWDRPAKAYRLPRVTSDNKRVIRNAVR